MLTMCLVALCELSLSHRQSKNTNQKTLEKILNISTSLSFTHTSLTSAGQSLFSCFSFRSLRAPLLSSCLFLSLCSFPSSWFSLSFSCLLSISPLGDPPLPGGMNCSLGFPVQNSARIHRLEETKIRRMRTGSMKEVTKKEYKDRAECIEFPYIIFVGIKPNLNLKLGQRKNLIGKGDVVILTNSTYFPFQRQVTCSSRSYTLRYHPTETH